MKKENKIAHLDKSKISVNLEKIYDIYKVFLCKWSHVYQKAVGKQKKKNQTLSINICFSASYSWQRMSKFLGFSQT